jgi:hypothetical protein
MVIGLHLHYGRILRRDELLLQAMIDRLIAMVSYLLVVHAIRANAANAAWVDAIVFKAAHQTQVTSY